MTKSPLPTSQFIGSAAEDQACCYLQQHGLILIEKNYRRPQGEIDLIMRDQDYLVFVEVRFRQEADYGNSLETVSKHKQYRIIKTALCYLQEEKLLDKVNCRFDCIGIDSTQNELWVKNAFDVQY